jgi:hypothetical protein
VPASSQLFEQHSESCVHGSPEGTHEGAGPASLAQARCVPIVRLKINGAAYFARRRTSMKKSRRVGGPLVEAPF